MSTLLEDPKLEAALEARGWDNHNLRYRYHDTAGLLFKCTSCKEYLPINQFNGDRNRHIGHRTACSDCRKFKRGRGHKRPTCDKGHDYWSDGTFYFSEGERKCLTCRREADQEWLRANPVTALV